MRRAFTLQMYDNGDLHAHDCAYCGKRWECRLDCTVSWVSDDKSVEPLDMGEDTVCAQCMEKPLDDSGWTDSDLTIIEDLQAFSDEVAAGKR